MTDPKFPFLLSILSSACLFCSLLSSSYAYQFNVGGKYGWVTNPSENYNHWSGRMRFQVNDTLLFNYMKSDSVLLVSKDDYEKCNTKKPIMKMDDGNSIFKFDRSGPFYFISGTQQNCQKGQKMMIVVIAVRNNNVPSTPPKASSPPVAPPPEGNMPSSPSPAEATGLPSPASSPVASQPPSTTTVPPQASHPPANAPTPSSFPISPPSPYPGTSGPGTGSPTPSSSTNVPGVNSPIPSPITSGPGAADSPTPGPGTSGPGADSPIPGPGSPVSAPTSTDITPPTSSATPGSPEESTAPSLPGSGAANADSPADAPPKSKAVSPFNPIVIMLITIASVVLTSVLL